MKIRTKERLKHIYIHGYIILWILIAMFPVVWIISMSLNPISVLKPTTLTIIPPNATLQAYKEILLHPYAGADVPFYILLMNSIIVAGGTALLSVGVGASAAYAFSRFKFPGRQVGMIAFLLTFMLPTTATLAPLFVILTLLKIRNTLFGLIFAYTATAIPFAIWNLKGYFDSVPKDLEEAALVDGCDRNTAFIKVILPLSVPAIAVTFLFGFMNGWMEWMLAWTFLTRPQNFTLAMTLYNLQGQWNTPWSNFAAFAILISMPVILVWFLLQRYIVSGLTLGSVKG
jgi:arabinogalactan oligomer/maltooligosaccharide transport system permease protein